MQLVHDIDLLLNQLLLHSPSYGYELGGEVVAGGSFATAVYDAECACTYNSMCNLMPLSVGGFKLSFWVVFSFLTVFFFCKYKFFPLILNKAHYLDL